MLMPDAYSARPEAYTAFQWRCVVCGSNREHLESSRPTGQPGSKYPGRYQLMVAWGWDSERLRHTLPLAFHAGKCWLVLDAIERERDDLLWLSDNVSDVNRYIVNNFAKPSTPGRRGVIERYDWPVDLLWTHEILTAIGSPLITAGVTS